MTHTQRWETCHSISPVLLSHCTGQSHRLLSLTPGKLLTSCSEYLTATARNKLCPVGQLGWSCPPFLFNWQIINWINTISIQTLDFRREKYKYFRLFLFFSKKQTRKNIERLEMRNNRIEGESAESLGLTQETTLLFWGFFLSDWGFREAPFLIFSFALSVVIKERSGGKKGCPAVLSTPLTLQEKKEKLSPKIGCPAQKQSLWSVPPCRTKEQTYPNNSTEHRSLKGTISGWVEKEQAERTEQSEQHSQQQKKNPTSVTCKRRDFFSLPLPKLVIL